MGLTGHTLSFGVGKNIARWQSQIQMGLVGRLQWEKSVPGREFPTSAGRGRERGRQAGCRGEMGDVGAGGPDSLQTSSPVRKRNRAASFSALRPSGPYIAGRRPATPQSPERLRSTPFDCVAIAPCCFAKRKAVLSHALAALTALNGARAKPGGRRSRR